MENDPEFTYPKDFRQKQMEIFGTLQIMGPIEAMEAFDRFTKMAERGFGNQPLDKQQFHESFTALNGALCCEIHGEKQCPLPSRSTDNR